MNDHATAARPDEPHAARLLGLPGFVVLAAAEVGGELEVLVETDEVVTGCPVCGVVAVPHGRRETLVRDVPAAGRPVLLVWVKRLWRCAEARCPRWTWTEASPAIAARASLTERARRWACRRVGRDGATVAAIAAELGVGWNTVWRAVVAYGTPVVDDPDRLAGVDALGVDEHVWQHAGPARRGPLFATGIVDLTRGQPPRLLDVVPGRSGGVYAAWIAEGEPAWRDAIRVAALDPFRGYATALRVELPEATRVLDAFHVGRLGNAVVDDVRRRVQHEQLDHRGHKHDPLYQVRRLLRRGAEHLTNKQAAKLEAALQAGDPTFEVTVAWHAAQALRRIYHAPPRRRVGRGRSRCSTRCPTARSPKSPASAAPCAPGSPSCWPTSTPTAPPTARPRR